MEKKLLDHLQSMLKNCPFQVPQMRWIHDETGQIHGCAYPYLQGVPLTAEQLAALPSNQRHRLAEQLGSFLTLLHSIPINIGKSIGIPLRDRSYWSKHLDNIINYAGQHMEKEQKKSVKSMFEEFFAWTSFSPLPEAIIHGDLRSDHILVHPHTYDLVGIIDFGDACIGDPAFDFAGIWNEYGESFAQKVMGHYHSKDVDHPVPLLERVHRFYAKQADFYKMIYLVKDACDNRSEP